MLRHESRLMIPTEDQTQDRIYTGFCHSLNENILKDIAAFTLD